jgi:hypothetical protein
MGRLWNRLALAFSAPKGPCTCDGCTGREPNRSRSLNVSHGAHVWVRDGKIHWRAKSRIVAPWPR